MGDRRNDNPQHSTKQLHGSINILNSYAYVVDDECASDHLIKCVWITESSVCRTLKSILGLSHREDILELAIVQS